MKRYQSKGAALIVAVMVVFVLTITAAGFFYITNWTTTQARGGYTNMRLFWAAESGANHALKWIKRLKIQNFGQATEAAAARDYFNAETNINSFKLYADESADRQTTVTMTLGYNAIDNEWSITSTAVQGNGEDVTVTISDIGAVNPAKYSYGLVTNQMARHKRFWQGDYIDGELYSSGGLNFGPSPKYNLRPHFNSKVSLARSYGASLSPVDVDNDFYLFDDTYKTKFEGWMASQSNAKLGNYENGLFACKGGGSDTKIANVTEFNAVMNDIFPAGIEIVDKIDPQNGVCYSWADFNSATAAPELKRYTIGTGNTANTFNSQGNKVKIEFSVVGDKTKAKIYTLSYTDNTLATETKTLKETITIGSGTGEYNTILVPKCTTNDASSQVTGYAVTNYSYVAVEGTIANSACLVTESNDVVITGDIKYLNLDYPASYFNVDIVEATQTNKIRAMQDEITSENSITPKFSILSGIGPISGTINSSQQNNGLYGGDVWVKPVDKDKKNVIVSATIFSPIGMFGGFNYGSVSGWNFKTINIGSVLMYDKGGWHGFGRGEITPNFYDDPRYKDCTDRPLGYIPAVGSGMLVSPGTNSEQLNILNYGYNWKVTR